MLAQSCIAVWDHDSSVAIVARLQARQQYVHGALHHHTNLIEMTNKMQLCRTIYYSIVS